MIREFSLPVNPEQNISVVYQCPDDEDAARKPLVILMHDFPGGDKASVDNLFADIEARFAILKFPCVRFDFRGSGESDCTPAEFSLDTGLEDLNAVMEWAKKDVSHHDFILLGEGIGAAVAVLGYNPKTVHGLMLLWPAVVLKDTWLKDMFTREARLEADKRDAPFMPFKTWRLGTPFFNDVYKTDLRVPLEKVKAPVFIQHGTADTVVPVEQAYFARDHLGGPVEVAIFEDGDHGLTAPNMRKAMFTNLEYFMAQTLKKLASQPKN